MSENDVKRVSWRDAALVAAPIVALVTLAFLAAWHFVKPAPPDRLAMATGPANGSYQKFAEKYRDILQKSGVTLDLTPSAGSVENLQRLRTGAAAAALVQGGILIDESPADARKDWPILSLGAMYPEPLWLFYKGTPKRTISRLGDLAGLRVAIGPEGSGTRFLAFDLMRAAGIDPAAARLSPLAGGEAADALARGEIDAVFVVAAINAPLVAQLMSLKGMQVASLAHAGAFARQFQFVRPLTVPRGLVSVSADLPDRDVQTVAVTANLLVRKDLHPALMYLLLEAASQVHGPHTLLVDAGSYPNGRNQDAPLADQADRFYKEGKPFLHRYVPFWLANFIDRVLVLAIPLFAVLVPAIRYLPGLYAYRLKNKVTRCYAALRALEADIERSPDPTKVPEYLTRLDAIEDTVNHSNLPSRFADQAYSLRAAIDLVRERLGRPSAKAIPGLRT